MREVLRARGRSQGGRSWGDSPISVELGWPDSRPCPRDAGALAPPCVDHHVTPPLQEHAWAPPPPYHTHVVYREPALCTLCLFRAPREAS